VANKLLAKRLFRALEIGDVEATTSDAVVAEVASILTSPRHYGAPREDAAKTIRALLSLMGLRMDSKAECLHALDVWERAPKLSFPDSLAVAYSRLRGHAVATFDRRLLSATGVTAYDFGGGKTPAGH
jgi:predicted nucleic acid-binding protein